MKFRGNPCNRILTDTCEQTGRRTDEEMDMLTDGHDEGNRRFRDFANAH